MSVRLAVDPLRPEEEVLAQALAILKGGGVVAYPTETFYGLGADIRQPAAVEKVFLLKGRSYQNPLPVIIHSREVLSALVREIPPQAETAMHRFWPGPLTLVFWASAAVPRLVTAGTEKIGVRVSSHAVALALARGLAGPITATSANLAGGRECVSADEVSDLFGSSVDAVLDSGPTAGGKGSTILDVTTAPPMILRQGAIDAEALLSSLVEGPAY
jgi:L-threonylcarbamoyladenylate synthase